VVGECFGYPRAAPVPAIDPDSLVADAERSSNLLMLGLRHIRSVNTSYSRANLCFVMLWPAGLAASWRLLIRRHLHDEIEASLAPRSLKFAGLRLLVLGHFHY
jgi:hypothetical protein